MLFAVFFLAGFIITTGIMFQALGKGAQAAVLALARQIVCFLPLVYVLPRYLGATGSWLSLPIADFMTFLLAGLFLFVEFHRRTGIFREITSTGTAAPDASQLEASEAGSKG